MESSTEQVISAPEAIKLHKLTIIPFRPEMAAKVVHLWRQSMEKALAPFESLHSIENQIDYLVTNLFPRTDIQVAIDESTILGFMVRAGTTIEQLYIHPKAQRLGIGSQFLDIAKEFSPEQLTLATFERNLQAQNFYLKNGFKEIRRGNTNNEEGLPDIEMQWRPQQIGSE